MDRRTRKNNIRDGVSTYRRYWVKCLLVCCRTSCLYFSRD
jgi:hypothetical protein